MENNLNKRRKEMEIAARKIKEILDPFTPTESFGILTTVQFSIQTDVLAHIAKKKNSKENLYE